MSYSLRKMEVLLQTGSTGTLIGWKSGQTTFVPLWDRMEGAWLRTPGEGRGEGEGGGRKGERGVRVGRGGEGGVKGRKGKMKDLA